MIITFYSNFLNHHQLPLCQELLRLTNNNFFFVATLPTPDDRLKLGYHDMNKDYPFVITTYDSQENRNKAFKLSLTSDVVIHGSAPEEYIVERINQNKLTFRYLERLGKRSFIHGLSPNFLRLVYLKHIRNKHKELYVLCASAYTAKDYALYGCYRNKCIKWGYFPDVINYDVDDLLKNKDTNLILWVGRLIDWKHPEVAVKIAVKLVKDGIPFKMRIIGTGNMENELRDLINEHKLASCVELVGSLSPEEVRNNMEKASVFLFTSNKQEGWGAVLNEAMNSCCAIVASHIIGSVPYLIIHNENGLIYHSSKLEELYKNVKYLMERPDERARLGKAAHRTISGEWSARIAAERLIGLSECILSGGNFLDLYPTGPCSPAEIIKDDWQN